MTRLDDYLEPLHRGVWEVAIPREKVTEPTDAGWKWSDINVPSPGTIASYRKGRFHAHETKTEWRVHLDRHDPAFHPLLHLVDDAPLVLMISDTFMTLILDTRRGEIRNTEELLRTQRYIWQEQVISGLVLGLAGLRIVRNPDTFFCNLFELFIPIVVTGLAFVVLARALRPGLPKTLRILEILKGTGIFCAGIFAYVLPLVSWTVSVLVVLAVWMTASAIVVLSRVVRGRSFVPEGLYSRMAAGLASLVLAVLLVISPGDFLYLLMAVLGLMGILAGMTLCINGLRLRRWMRHDPAGYGT